MLCNKIKWIIRAFWDVPDLSWHNILSVCLELQNFNAVGPTLSKKAKSVSAQFEERHGAKTVKDFKLFVDRLPQMQVRRSIEK